jgi:hypothetical protein
MSFFDEKEEVLEFTMTKHGERKLALGEFDPAYYSFGDSDVLYNSDFGGFTESQTDIKERIFNALRIKPQSSFGGIESNIQKYHARVVNGENFYDFDQQEADKTYATIKSLGTSKIGSEIYPSWKVRCYNAGIESATQFISGTANVRIPQINLAVNKVYINKIFNVPDRLRDALLGAGIPALDFGDRFNQFPDGSILEVADDNILIEIEEYETEDDFDNFEVEFFFSEIETLPSGDTREVLTPLKFLGEDNTQKDLDIWQPEQDPNPSLDPNPDFVEYFLDIEFDKDIEPQVLCAWVEQDKARGVYGQRIVEECLADRIRLSDIYQTGIVDEEC